MLRYRCASSAARPACEPSGSEITNCEQARDRLGSDSRTSQRKPRCHRRQPNPTQRGYRSAGDETAATDEEETGPRDARRVASATRTYGATTSSPGTPDAPIA